MTKSAARSSNVNTAPPLTDTQSMPTPRRKARFQLREAGVSPRVASNLRRKLELHNAIINELADSDSTEKIKKSKLNPITVVTGTVRKKCRLQSRLSRARHIQATSVASKLKQLSGGEKEQIARKPETHSGTHRHVPENETPRKLVAKRCRNGC